MKKLASIGVSLLLVSISVIVVLLLGEAVLRMKNASMKNYDIEMWRYSRELKTPSPFPDMDFDHVKSKSAILQSVEVRLNEWGLRGGPVEPLTPGRRRILFLGGSATLGWGVAEKETVEVLVESALRAKGENVEVLNGGVGNYNSVRYVTRYFNELSGLHPTDIVINFFPRDAEELAPGGGNILLRNSELAVTLWIAYHRLFDNAGAQALTEHYRRAFQADAPGFLRMKDELRRLAEYARANHIRIYFAMTPDVHDLIDYKLGFAHEAMMQLATGLGYKSIDFLPAFAGRQAQELWAMPGDPHPNALGHRLMAEALAPLLAQAGSSSPDISSSSRKAILNSR